MSSGTKWLAKIEKMAAAASIQIVFV
jgi:hypothetical protein